MKMTELTSHLIHALKQAEAIDLGKLHASALDVSVPSYSQDRQAHVDRVSIAAERFAPVRSALIVALRQEIEARRKSLQRELREAEMEIARWT